MKKHLKPIFFFQKLFVNFNQSERVKAVKTFIKKNIQNTNLIDSINLYGFVLR